MNYRNILNEILASKSTCLLGSVNKEGYPVIRAMLNPMTIKDEIFYLHTNTSSSKVQQFIDNNKSCLYFYNDDTFKGLMITGDMTVISDFNEKKSFWKDDYKIYYSNGVGMSDFTVLKFMSLTGNYYKDFKVTELDKI